MSLDGLAFSASGDASVPDAWWTALGDPALDAHVRDALGANFSVRAAFARLDGAQAVVRRTRAALAPSVSADVGGNLSSDGPLGGGRRAPFEVGLGISWEIDLWGRVRAQVDGETARTAATREDARAAALSLSAEVAEVWVGIAAAHEQLALLDAQIATNQSLIEVVEARVLHGLAGPADLHRQERLLEQTRAQRIAADADLQVLHHQLPVLLGRPPQESVSPLPTALPPLPPLPDAGVPAELIRRRPDLRASEHALRAADADVAAAIADLFPRLTIGAGTSWSPPTAESLLAGWLASLAASVVAPLFEGGARRAEVRRNRAVVEQRLAEYGDAALRALQEVEDALVRDRQQDALVQNVARRVALAERAVESLGARYQGGHDVGFLDVVTAQAAAQQLQREQIDQRRRHLEQRIGLYRALAGGIDPADADLHTEEAPP